MKQEAKGYGTFFGVFLPSILPLFGVVLYLRLGVILGKVGLVSMLSIIGFSCFITLTTALSISTIATNMSIGKGGAYYIVSRSLGIDFGSAVGIPLYLSQTICIAFYLMGFTEALGMLFPMIDPTLLSLGVLGLLGITCFYSTAFVLKSQIVMLGIFVCAMASFFTGGLEGPIEHISLGKHLGYWTAFALFFPAVTGIEAGLSLSGNLRQTKRSLPLGTIGAVLVGLAVYLSVTLFLWSRVPRAELANNPMILTHFARYGLVVLVGIWGGTLMSAFGSLLGAPRTLQALAQDGIVFKFLGKEQGKRKEPRIATLLTVLLVAGCLYFGSLDLLAPILTMFFLITYGMLNLVSGFESLMHNPSWRPSFAVPTSISFLGALSCLVAMLMINSGATLIAMCIVAFIYLFLGRKLHANWGDIRFGLLMFFSRRTVYQLANSDQSARTWRPHVLSFSPSITPPQSLLDFTSAITRNTGFLTFAHLAAKEQGYNIDAMKKTMLKALKKSDLQAIVEVGSETNILSGYKRLINAYGMGPLAPNTFILYDSEKTKERDHFPEMVIDASLHHRNVIIMRGESKAIKKIDLWWDSNHRDTSQLMLVLAHMYQSAKGAKHLHITLKGIVNSEAAREGRLKYFVDLFEESRLNLDTKVYVAAEEDSLKLVSNLSQEADLVFYSLRAPHPEESPEDYKKYFFALRRSLKSLRNLALVSASEAVNFKEIFK